MYSTMRRLPEKRPESRIKATSEREVDFMGYVTGKTIRELREKRGMPQRELAQKIQVSDKTVSKWETEKGLPDIGIIEDLADIKGVFHLTENSFCCQRGRLVALSWKLK